MRKSLVAAFAASALFVGCDSAVTSPNQTSTADSLAQEALVKVQARILNASDVSDSLTVTWSDTDGVGAAAPILPANVIFKAQQSYTIAIQYQRKKDAALKALPDSLTYSLASSASLVTIQGARNSSGQFVVTTGSGKPDTLNLQLRNGTTLLTQLTVIVLAPVAKEVPATPNPPILIEQPKPQPVDPVDTLPVTPPSKPDIVKPIEIVPPRPPIKDTVPAKPIPSIPDTIKAPPAGVDTAVPPPPNPGIETPIEVLPPKVPVKPPVLPKEPIVLPPPPVDTATPPSEEPPPPPTEIVTPPKVPVIPKQPIIIPPAPQPLPPNPVNPPPQEVPPVMEPAPEPPVVNPPPIKVPVILPPISKPKG